MLIFDSQCPLWTISLVHWWFVALCLHSQMQARCKSCWTGPQHPLQYYKPWLVRKLGRMITQRDVHDLYLLQRKKCISFPKCVP